MEILFVCLVAFFAIAFMFASFLAINTKDALDAERSAHYITQCALERSRGHVKTLRSEVTKNNS